MELLQTNIQNFIPWQETIGVVEMILKGTIIGIVVSAPMGPVGVLCIQRTLNKGRLYGLATGLGAALSDIIYAFITGYGMSFIVHFIEDPRIMFWLKMVGSVLLFVFGIYTFRSNPVQSIRPVSHNKGTLVHNFVTGFFITFSNPLIIFLFVAMFSQFTFILPDNPLPQVIGYIFVVVGAVLWWFVLTLLIDKVRNKFDVRGIWIINRIIGVIVMLVSALVVANTLMGNSFPMSY
jgi:threonine/homoserine/homoserine lactone efflux protein